MMPAAEVYEVHGQWLTVSKIAMSYHVSTRTLRRRMAQGMTMEQAADMGNEYKRTHRYDWGGGLWTSYGDFMERYGIKKGWLDYLLYQKCLTRPQIHRLILEMRGDPIPDDIDELTEEPEPEPVPEPEPGMSQVEAYARKVLASVVPGIRAVEVDGHLTVTGLTIRWYVLHRTDGLYELHALTLTTGEETSGPWLYTRDGILIKNTKEYDRWQE